MNIKLKDFTKHYETILIIIAIIVTLGIGRASTKVMSIDFGQKTTSNVSVPLTYSDISTSTNEKGEIVIMKKESGGYKVLFVLSDTVAKGISNLNLNQRYQGKI